MADESVLEVIIKMREEGQEALREIKDQLKDIRDALKDLQDQAKDTNGTLRDTATQATATQMAFSFMADETNKLRTAQRDLNDEATRGATVFDRHKSSIDNERSALKGMVQDYRDAKLVSDALGGSVGVTGATFERLAAQVFDTDEKLLQDRDQMAGMKQAMKDSRDAASALGATLGVTGAEFEKVAEQVFTMNEAEARQKETSDRLLQGYRDSQHAASVLGATIGVTGSEFDRLAQEVFAATGSEDKFTQSQNQATNAQNTATQAAKNSIFIITGLVGALQVVGIVAAIALGAFLVFGPVILQFAGYVVVTTAYLVGLVTILAAFTAGMVGTIILLATTIGLLGGMAAAVVYLADRLFTTGQILTDPLLGLENNLSKMADTWGQKALPMANQIIAWLNTLIPIVQKAGNALLTWFGGHLGDLLNIASIAVGILTDNFGKLWKDLQPLLNFMIATAPVWEQLIDLLLKLANSAIIWLVQQLLRLQAWFTQELPIILPIVMQIFGAIGQATTGLAENIGRLVDWFVTRLPAMKPIAEDTLGGIGNFIQWLGGVAGHLVDFFINNWPAITTGTKETFKTIKEGWDEVAPGLQIELPIAIQIISEVFHDMTNHAQSVHDILFLIGIVAGVTAASLLAGVAIIAILIDTFSQLWVLGKDIYQVFQNITTAIDDMIVNIANLIPGLNGLITAIQWLRNQASNNAPSGPHGIGSQGGSPDSPQLSYQAGGTVPGSVGQAQLAIVHGGEVVLSNDRQNDIVNLLASIDHKLSGNLFPTSAYGRV